MKKIKLEKTDVPQSPRSYRKAFASTVRRAIRNNDRVRDAVKDAS